MDERQENGEEANGDILHLRRQLEGLSHTHKEFQESEKELKRAQELVELIFRFSPSAIFTVTPDRIITSWNQKAEELTGYRAQEVIGKSCAVFAEKPCPDKCDLFNEPGLTPVIGQECTIRRRNGQIRIISRNAAVIRDDAGNVTAGIEALEDITVRRQAEDALKRAYELLDTQVRERTSELSKINAALVVEIAERKNVQEEFQKGCEKLQRVLGETIRALAQAVEKRDPYTSGHQQRVAHLACAIAQIMKIDADKVNGVETAALVHDIGKIYVPAEILSKPSQLTKIEFSLITVHPQIGYDILKDIEFPWPVADIVLQHHERVNGSGYPQGLTADKILMESHILIVADVVEAMASHRPYRPALGVNFALDEIRQKRGLLYDEQVVDACVSLFLDKGFQFMKV